MNRKKKEKKPMNMKNKLKKHPVKNGDNVLVRMMSEPLQEEFDALEALTDQLKDSVGDLYKAGGPEDAPMELKIRCETLDAERDIAFAKFWLNVKKTYGLWGKNIGIREGYAVVEEKGGGKPEVEVKEMGDMDQMTRMMLMLALLKGMKPGA